MCAPAPHKWFGLRTVICSIPSYAFCFHIDSKLTKLICRIFCKRLANRVSIAEHKCQFCFLSIFFSDTIFSFCPSSLVHQSFCCIQIVFCHCLIIIPRHFITYTVCNRSVTVQHIIDHFLSVNGKVNGTTHIHIRSQGISVNNSVFFFRFCCGKVKSSVVNCIYTHQVISFDFLVTVGSCRMCHICLSCHSRCKGSVLFHKKNGKLFNLWLLSVVIRICLKDYLLPLIPLFHNITSGTDGILSVCLAVSVLRYDSHDCHCIRPDRIRLIHMKFHSGIIYCNSLF